MNFVPLVVALVVVVLYIVALKLLGPPPSAQTSTMLNLVIGLIIFALIVAAFWPLVTHVTK